MLENLEKSLLFAQHQLEAGRDFMWLQCPEEKASRCEITDVVTRGKGRKSMWLNLA